jgi:hypothetical protein
MCSWKKQLLNGNEYYRIGKDYSCQTASQQARYSCHKERYSYATGGNNCRLQKNKKAMAEISLTSGGEEFSYAG